MNKVNTTFASITTGQPIVANAGNGTLPFIQNGIQEAMANIIKGTIGRSYTTNDVILIRFKYVISGGGNTMTWEDGSIFYNGEIYTIAAGNVTKSGGQTFVFTLPTNVYDLTIDPITFKDSSTHSVHEIRRATISAGSSGSGIANYNGATVKPLSLYTTTITDIFASATYSSSTVDLTITALQAYNVNNIIVLNLSITVVFKSDTGGGDGGAEITFNSAFKPINTVAKSFPSVVYDSSTDALVHIRNMSIGIATSGSDMVLQFIGAGTNSGGSYNRKSFFNITLPYQF